MELSCINLKGAAAKEKEGNPQEKKRETEIKDERRLLRCEAECRKGTGFSCSTTKLKRVFNKRRFVHGGLEKPAAGIRRRSAL